ncbi:MAG: sporulation protein YabP [Clostridiales bacterium]|nr:sporulation protein YabP [Clostridiales bacterium]
MNVIEEKRPAAKRHFVQMENREKATFTGVEDVLNFDEELIAAQTSMGTLIIHGENLHISRLNTESGELNIEGSIQAMEYQESGYGGGKSSILARLFR